MSYLKEHWIELTIFLIGGVLIGFIFSVTWKYSNYALYDRINKIESHVNILAGAVEKLQSEDVYIRSITK